MWPFTREAKRFAALDDVVWFAGEALRVGVAQRAVEGLRAGRVLVVAHFPESVGHAAESLRAIGAGIQMVRGDVNAVGMRDQLRRLEAGQVALVQASQLKPAPRRIGDEMMNLPGG